MTSDAEIIDRQFETFRSPDGVLNDLAIIHRLAVTAGRHKFGAHEGARLAIKSIKAAKSLGAYRQSHDLRLKLHAISQRKGITTSFSADAISTHGHRVVRIKVVFDVIPAALVSFLRQGQTAAPIEETSGEGLGSNYVIYQPDDRDNISDGERVDHIPALRLIDIGLGIALKEGLSTIVSTINASFISFIDPQRPVCITWTTDEAHLHFIQNYKKAAAVSF
ncbi:hypothetical protein ACQKI5_23595 [Agrobacterium tumefaciens]|uniref:hypothetical protein n=1 Tax=Agrobacterium tumefaciens TaxID=358 RepID=UPI003D01D469